MPDTPRVKASGLPVATALNDADLAIGVQAGITKTFPGELFLRLAQRGQPNGVAGLDSNGIVAQAVRLMRSAGGAGAPALAFDGDPDTGLFRPAANEVGISVGGTARLFVRPGGVESDRNLTLDGSNRRIYLGSASSRSIIRGADVVDGAALVLSGEGAGVRLRPTSDGDSAEEVSVTLTEFTRSGNEVVGSGENSNGQWLRFYDGTQICWRQDYLAGVAIDNATGALYRSPELQRRSFPQAFSGNVEASHITVMSGINNALQWVATSADSGASATEWPKFYLLDTQSVASVDVRVTFYAFGRWF